MTWASSVITAGFRNFLGSGVQPPAKSGHHQQSVLIVAAEKGDTSKMVKPEKCGRGLGDDFAAILHDSNTCQGASLGPPRLACYLDLQCKVHSVGQQQRHINSF